MAVITSGNWSFRDPGDDVPDRSAINGGNFSQLLPGTEILKGKKLTINGGNFVNVKRQPEWTVNGGNWAQISRCSHVHPEWVARGLKPCPEDCKHRVSAEKQWVHCEVDEFRSEKHSLLPTKAPVQLIGSTDADGVVTQRFEKQVYVYQDTGA